MGDIEEFKAIIKIIPTDEETTIKICDAVEKFTYENSEESQKIMEELVRKFKGTKEYRKLMEVFGVE